MNSSCHVSQSHLSEGKLKPAFHKDGFPLLTSFCSFLCDAEHRIGKEGGQHGGATQIKNHPFFRGVVWDQLRKIRAPFEPRLSSNVDVSYFPVDEIPQEDNSAAHRAQVRAMPEDQEAEMSLPFIGYTYKAFNAFQAS
jgi:protein-serine/threonine kinase